MTTISIRRAGNRADSKAVSASVGVGWEYALLLIWLFFEYGRPANPLKIPLAISVISLVTWLARRRKQWTPYTVGFLAILGGAAIGVPLSKNTYASFWATYDMGILFLAICLPLQSLVTSVARTRVWVMVFLAIAFYIGGWAATHGGYGPSGGSGGQDENYIAAMMCLAIALAYFSLFAEKARFAKIALAGMMMIFVSAIALADNPSRGGFIGLCAVALYCLMRSPKKMVGLGTLGVVGLVLVIVAGPAFWAEIATSTDTTSATADIRIEIWKVGVRMWQANPFFGVGAGNFRWSLDEFQSAEQFAKFGRSLGGSIIAHSLWVEMLSELGLVGVFSMLFLVYKTWKDLGRVRDDAQRRTKVPNPDIELVRFRCYADGLRAGILAILVNGVFLSLFYYSYLWLLLALGGGLCYVYRTRGYGTVMMDGAGPEPAVAPVAMRRRGAPLPNPAATRMGSRVAGRRG